MWVMFLVNIMDNFLKQASWHALIPLQPLKSDQRSFVTKSQNVLQAYLGTHTDTEMNL